MQSQSSGIDEDTTVSVAPTDEEEASRGKTSWKRAQQVAKSFFDWLHQSQLPEDVDLASVDREKVHVLFQAFLQREPQAFKLEGAVMAALGTRRLMRSKRYSSDGFVVCSFANQDGNSFPPMKERKTAIDKIRDTMRERASDKGGLVVAAKPATEPKGDVLPVKHPIKVQFNIHNTIEQNHVKLVGVDVAGPHKSRFQIKKSPRMPRLVPLQGTTVELDFRSTTMGLSRANVSLAFKMEEGKSFSILRHIILRTGNADMYDILKPKSPYVKKKRIFDAPMPKKNIVQAPRMEQGVLKKFKYNNLKKYAVPTDVREMVRNLEMETALVPPGFEKTKKEFKTEYSTFWKNLLWVSELQAYEDVKLFDMQNASLERLGKYFKLYVDGLAEGRPSVLKGDLVYCNWKGKQYRGRVHELGMLYVLLHFDKSFHRNFNVSVDRLDLVRFTVTRTTFRTSHEGIFRAPETLQQRMLFPEKKHIRQIRSNRHNVQHRDVPSTLRWASQQLNDEQKNAVKEIVSGSLRPMPYMIFRPPGTGKTTTLVEAVYQLARVHTYNKAQSKLKILLVAPSNDASDILVEKLSQYFPKTEMIRVLAFTRNIDQVPDIVKPYVREGLDPNQLAKAILATKVQIVVTTVNLAARLSYMSDELGKNRFDVLCMDEAGHATEPKLMGVAATLMKFAGKNPGQMVLAGDPRQLGPIVTSYLGKKFGMGMSFIERLMKTSPAYALDNNYRYPSELVTQLVRNYRSHPTILKLPNEMFYGNKLVACGDPFVTHSMARWEYLPTENGFPMFVHAVDGENLREGSSPSWFNPQEAETVVDYVKLLVNKSRPPISEDEIGVITPYQRQVEKIRTALKASDVGGVKVGSVETFQGQERRCIIISTVRSENSLLEHDLKYNLGFVANEKRFNVAVTRAKSLLIIVGNPKVLASDKKNWLPMLRLCKSNRSWAGDDWNENTVEEEQEGDQLPVGEVETDDDEEGEGWHIVLDQEATGYINREE